MHKLLTILFFLILLSSCTKNDDNVVLKRILPKPIIIEKINWDENIEFIHCSSITDYSRKKDYNKKEDIILLKDKLKKYKNKHNKVKGIISIIGEYCKNDIGDKYILWEYNFEGYSDVNFFIYDKNSDTLEKTKVKSTIFKNSYFQSNILSKNLGSNKLGEILEEYISEKTFKKGFGNIEGDTIKISNYGIVINGNEGSSPSYKKPVDFLTEREIKFCEKGLTPGKNSAYCFIDIYYTFNYKKNTLFEEKVCSYYIGDSGKINELHECIDNKWSNIIGYDLTAKARGIKLYQSKNKYVSIIDVDLSMAGVSFGGVEQNKTTYKKKGDLEGYINKVKSNRLFSYDLLEEKGEEPDLYNFKRSYVSRSFGEINYLLKDNIEFPIFAAVNGQFFDQNKNPTFLSFPVKSEGKILSSYMDNELPKRTLIIDNNENVSIINGYKKEYLNNKNNIEVLVGLNPEVDSSNNNKIGRSYIGILGNNKIVFFVSIASTQAQMEKIITDYGVKKENIIMMDGGPSAQLGYFDLLKESGGETMFYGSTQVPHFNLIYTK